MSIPSKRKETYGWKYSTKWVSTQRERGHIPENILPNEDPLEEKGDIAESILKKWVSPRGERRHIVERVLIYEHPDAVEGDSWT